MYTLHATKKLLDRLAVRPAGAAIEPTTAMGNWYGNVLPWRRAVILLVNEGTLVPVMLPLAPAATLTRRIPDAVGALLGELGAPSAFVDLEIAAMADVTIAKTANRSVLGTMNDFALMADTRRNTDELLALAAWLAHTPCSPLRDRSGFPDLELATLIERHPRPTTNPRPQSIDPPGE